MTENYAVFLSSSMDISLPGPLFGSCTLSDRMQYSMGKPITGFIVDLRSMQLLRRFELPPGIVVHFGNSFEVGDEIVTDLMMSSDTNNFSGLRDVFNIDRLTGGPLYRYRFNVKSGEIKHELYYHVPFGFHGHFSSEVFIDS